jgi:hypothetical protein
MANLDFHTGKTVNANGIGERDVAVALSAVKHSPDLDPQRPPLPPRDRG